MGYGRRAVQLLQDYYEGKRHSLSELNSHSATTPLPTVSQVDFADWFFLVLLLWPVKIIFVVVHVTNVRLSVLVKITILLFLKVLFHQIWA